MKNSKVVLTKKQAKSIIGGIDTLKEKNNIYTRATKAQSDIQSKHNQSLNGITQNLKG